MSQRAAVSLRSVSLVGVLIKGSIGKLVSSLKRWIFSLVRLVVSGLRPLLCHVQRYKIRLLSIIESISIILLSECQRSIVA